MTDVVSSGIQEFGNFLNWPFLVTFVFLGIMLKEVLVFNYPEKPKSIIVFLVVLFAGIALASIFFGLGEEYTLREVLRYLVTIFFTMLVIYDGIKKWWKILRSRLYGTKR